MSAIRTIIASAMCDATNGPGTWECLPGENQSKWLHRADDLIHELAGRNCRCRTIDELEKSDV
jgi:hypothetical protein